MRLVARGATLLLVGGLLALQSTTPATATPDTESDATCSVGQFGAYADPVGLRKPYIDVDGHSRASGHRYYVEASGTAPTTLRVRRASTGAQVLQLDTVRTNWGFSPDQDRFLVWGVVDGDVEATLYDLTLPNPAGDPVWSATSPDHDDRFGWSPHGEYFATSAISGTQANTAVLRVYDSRTGVPRLNVEPTYTVTPPGGDDDFHGASWGFSPDDDEFVYAHTVGATPVEVRLVDLDAGVQRAQTTVTGAAWWQFSPRGDAFAVVEGVNQTVIRLYGTHSNSQLLGQWSDSSVYDAVLEATPDGHVLHYGPIPVDYTIAPYSPPSPDYCPPIWRDDAELTATDVTQTTLHLAWPGATAADPGPVDDTAVTGLRVQQRVGSTTTTLATLPHDAEEYDVTGLTAATAYTFSVQARDAAGHWSTDGPTLAVTTPSDVPHWASGAVLTVADVTRTSATLSWPAAIAGSGRTISGYRVYVDGVQRTQTAARTYALTGLSAASAHEVVVQAVDDTGAESTESLSERLVTFAPEQTDTAEITGTLYEDWNRNGVRDEGERGILTASDAWYTYTTLTATRVDASQRVLESRALTTGADGTFSATGLTPGTWVIGFDSWHAWIGVYPEHARQPVNPSPRSPYRLVIGADQGWSNVLVGVTASLPEFVSNYPHGPGTIEATVFDDTNANGVRDGGEGGVAGITAYCWGPGVIRLDWDDPFCEGTSDADGAVDIPGVPLGVHTLHALPFAQPTDDHWYSTDLHDRDQRLVVVGATGQPTPEFGVIHGESTISGGVFWDKDSSGTRDAGEPDFDDDYYVCADSDRWGRSCVSGADGDGWSIGHLPPGDYRVTLDAGPWRVTRGRDAAPALVHVGTNGAVVGAGDLGADQEWATIRGVVFDDANNDGVHQDTEEVRVGESIGVRRCGDEGSDAYETDADGEYEVRVLAGVAYCLFPESGGELTVPTSSAGITLAEDEVRDYDFGFATEVEVTPPGPPTGVQVTRGPGFLDVGWTAPEEPGDLGFYGAVAIPVGQEPSGSDPQCVTGPDATSCRIDGVDDALAYDVYVYACTSVETVCAGADPVTVPVGGATPTPTPTPTPAPSPPPPPPPPPAPVPLTRPAAPHLTKVTPGTRSATVTWRPGSVSAAVGAATGFRVQLQRDGRWVTKARLGAAGRSARITGLAAGVRVKLRVVAVNPAGPSRPSNVKRVRPLPR